MNNDTITLYPNRKKFIGIIVLFAIFVGIGIWIATNPGPRQRDWKGWLVVIFFGGYLIWTGTLLIPGAYYLKLTKTSFTQCRFWRTKTIHWSDVAGFGIWEQAGYKCVGFRFTDDYRRTTAMEKITGLTSYADGAIQVNCGKTHEELYQLMNDKLAEWQSINPQWKRSRYNY